MDIDALVVHFFNPFVEVIVGLVQGRRVIASEGDDWSILMIPRTGDRRALIQF